MCKSYIVLPAMLPIKYMWLIFLLRFFSLSPRTSPQWLAYQKRFWWTVPALMKDLSSEVCRVYKTNLTHCGSSSAGQQIPSFYGTKWFIAVSTKASYWIVSRGSSLQFKSSHTVLVRLILTALQILLIGLIRDSIVSRPC